MVDKTQPERQRRYRAELKRKLKEAREELPARIVELEAEVADLRHQLAERIDAPAPPSLLDALSPESRTELERLIASGKLERVLEWTAKKHAEEEAQKAATPAVDEQQVEVTPTQPPITQETPRRAVPELSSADSLDDWSELQAAIDAAPCEDHRSGAEKLLLAQLEADLAELVNLPDEVLE